MSINFAGYDLEIEDLPGALRRQLNDYLDENFASIFCLPNTAINEGRYVSQLNPPIPSSPSTPTSGWPPNNTLTVRRVGIPVGNYPAPPKPKINSLYWPTGATRWAHGLFLVRASLVPYLIAACAGGNPATLNIDAPIANNSSYATGVSAAMYMLPPRPTTTIIGSSETLWLVPLVDARFFWQWQYVQQYTPASWGAALAAIQGRSGADTPNIGTAVSGNYGVPSALEFMREYENCAMLVDAIALTLQRRLVGIPTLTGNQFTPYVTQDPNSAATVAAANLAAGYAISAGGDFSSQAVALGDIPSNVVITFTDTSLDRVGGWSTAPTTPTVTAGGEKVFHCSMVRQSGISGAGQLIRGFEANLATQVAADYSTWFSLGYDVTYSGIVPWVPNGFDDYVRWEVGVVRDGRRKRDVAFTRACSMPPNFGCECLPIDPGSSSSSSPSSSQSSSSSISSSPSSSPSSSQSSQSSQSVSPSSSSPSPSSSGSPSPSSSSPSSQSSGSSLSSGSSGSSAPSSGSSAASSGGSSNQSSGQSSGSFVGSSSGTSSGSGGSSAASSGSGSGSSSSGNNCCVNVVTSVSCSGTSLSVTTQQLCISGGCLTLT